MNECEPPFSSSSSYWAVRVSCVCAWRLVLPFNLNTKTVWKYFQNISIQFLPFAFVSNNLIVCLKELKWIGRSKWLCTMDTKTMQELFTFFHLSHLFSKKNEHMKWKEISLTNAHILLDRTCGWLPWCLRKQQDVE